MASVPSPTALPPKWMVSRHFWPTIEEAQQQLQTRLAQLKRRG